MKIVIVILSVFFILIPFLEAEAPGERDTIVAAAFSEGPMEDGLPRGWKHLDFPGVDSTDYSLVRLDGKWVIKAESKGSASGFIRRLVVNPGIHRMMRWSWKIENLLAGSNLMTKKGDDHPGRMYVGFEYDKSQFSWKERFFYFFVRLFYGKDYPARSINYVWASNDPVGSVEPNPWTSWVKTVVVESGDARLGEWVHVERDIYEDYRNVFGGEPPMVSGVGIMTDSDGTESEAIAYFGDIVFEVPE